MSDRFYVNCPLAPGPVSVQGPEAHHLATVCRVRPGDAVCLFNGDGHEYPARVRDVSRRAVEVEVLAVESPDRELGWRLQVAAPLPKGDRASFLLEKLTELGVTAFFPLQTARGVVQPRETKLDRMQRHVIEASKQCGRNRLLRVMPLVRWDAFCTSLDHPEVKLLAHPGSPGSHAANPAPGADLVFAVGPEGGFTEEEVDIARSVGWQVVGLGPRTLRVETAALALAARFALQRP